MVGITLGLRLVTAPQRLAEQPVIQPVKGGNLAIGRDNTLQRAIIIVYRVSVIPQCIGDPDAGTVIVVFVVCFRTVGVFLQQQQCLCRVPVTLLATILTG